MDTPVPLQWHTEKRKINDLKAFDKNPRKLTAEQKEHLTASLKKFNLVEIPAIDVESNRNRPQGVPHIATSRGRRSNSIC